GKRVVSRPPRGAGVTVWDADRGKALFSLGKQASPLRVASFSPDGKRLATADGAGTVKVWDGESGRALLSFKGHINEVSCLCFSPDGERLASGGRDRAVRL